MIRFDVYHIKPQLEKILSNKDYLNQIKQSNKHRIFNKQNNRRMTSLDGKIHKSLPFDKEDELTISLNLNSDGAPLIKSRQFSLMPVVATIIELNQSSREKFQNMIILAIWLHNSKPSLDKFFKKAFEELIELTKNPFEISGF